MRAPKHGSASYLDLEPRDLARVRCRAAEPAQHEDRSGVAGVFLDGAVVQIAYTGPLTAPRALVLDATSRRTLVYAPSLEPLDNSCRDRATTDASGRPLALSPLRDAVTHAALDAR